MPGIEMLFATEEVQKDEVENHKGHAMEMN